MASRPSIQPSSSNTPIKHTPSEVISISDDDDDQITVVSAPKLKSRDKCSSSTHRLDVSVADQSIESTSLMVNRKASSLRSILSSSTICSTVANQSQDSTTQDSSSRLILSSLTIRSTIADQRSRAGSQDSSSRSILSSSTIRSTVADQSIESTSQEASSRSIISSSTIRSTVADQRSRAGREDSCSRSIISSSTIWSTVADQRSRAGSQDSSSRSILSSSTPQHHAAHTKGKQPILHPSELPREQPQHSKAASTSPSKGDLLLSKTPQSTQLSQVTVDLPCTLKPAELHIANQTQTAKPTNKPSDVSNKLDSFGHHPSSGSGSHSTNQPSKSQHHLESTGPSEERTAHQVSQCSNDGAWGKPAKQVGPAGSTSIPSQPKKRYLSPPKYVSGTAKHIAKLQRKLEKDTNSGVTPHVSRISLSEEPISSNPVITFPKHGKKTCNLICTSGGQPHIILETHSFSTQPSPTFNQLGAILSDLYKMALNQQPIKTNKNLLNGTMCGIGFRPGSDYSKSGGTYARRHKISEVDSIADSALWDNLQHHNDFIASRIQSLSKSAWEKTHKVAISHGVPNWNQTEWRQFKEDHNFAGNVIVTFNDFYNQVHEDSSDLNPWTYGIFSYINQKSGNPIPPPSQEKGHGLKFPRHAILIDYAHVNGIVEVFWQTTKFEHCTTPPPPSLQSSSSHTHVGCSFQINKKLAAVSDQLKNATDEQVIERTLCKDQKYAL